VLRCVLIVAGFVALYVIAYGPALSLAKRRVVPIYIVLRIYRPVPTNFQQYYLWYYSRLDSTCKRMP
jgi:hypothetical protein